VFGQQFEKEGAMKRGLIILGICLVLALVRLGCGNGDNILPTDCTNVSGDFNITKNITSVSAKKNGISVSIQNAATVMPTTSTLDITQTGCPLVAAETIADLNDLLIPYTGEADTHSGFTLSIENPPALAIPLKLRILGVDQTCKFNGAIDWDGSVSGRNLSGAIQYALTKRTDESNPNCPDTCTVIMGFAGLRQ
jgi:hypothetical protein